MGVTPTTHLKSARLVTVVLELWTLLTFLANMLWVVRLADNLAVAKVWNNRAMDAVSRSADAAYGQSYLEYVQFLRAEIPENALVVITRTTGLPQYDSLGFLQYFLFPRRLTYCPEGPNPDCLWTFSQRGAYFLAGEELVIPPEVLAGYDVVRFDQELLIVEPR